MKTWSDLIAEGAAMLDVHGLGEAEITAEYLAAHVLGIWARSDLRPHLHETATDTEQQRFDALLSRRLAHEPVQYIIGETEFYGLRLYCSPDALIPRAETEVLVEETIKEVSRLGGECNVLDIGTGTGAIALAVAKHCPRARVVGIDASSDAIALAKKNLKRLALPNVLFHQLRFPDHLGEIEERFDIVVSNPPYIPEEEMYLVADEVRSFEPTIALTDHADGFSFYRGIASHARELVKPGGMILVETEFKGAPTVRDIFARHGLTVLRTVNDLLGHERVVVAQMS